MRRDAGPRRPTRRPICALVLLVAVLGGCSNGGGPTSGPPVGSPASVVPTGDYAAANLPDGCTLLSDAEIESALSRKVISHAFDPSQGVGVSAGCTWHLDPSANGFTGEVVLLELSLPPEGAKAWVTNQRATLSGSVDVPGVGDGAFSLQGSPGNIVTSTKNIGIQIIAANNYGSAARDLLIKIVGRL